MKKPWSISTTVRNPDRIRGFLETLKNFEGKKFNEKEQINFQIALIKNKLYKPMGLSGKLQKYYDSPRNMSINQAKEIFKHMTSRSNELKKDPGLRGRTSIAPLSKMGLVVSKQTIAKLYITNFGNKFLKEDYDIGEIFLEYFFKWTLPNPDNNDFSEKDGFNIQPFIAAIKIINEVNNEWEKLGMKRVGISKEEFSIFVITTINYNDIPNTIKEIIEFRKNINGKSKEEQRIIKKKIFTEKINNFFNDPKGKNFDVNFRNLKDYGDNAIRYFKITRFFYIRGGGYFIDIELRRVVEIRALLEANDGSGIKFRTLDDYLEYMDKDIVYPWESIEKLREISTNLLNEIINLNKSLQKPKLIDKKVITLNLKNLSLPDLKIHITRLRSLRKEIQEYKDHLDLVDVNNFEKIISELENIHQGNEIKSVYLEYLTTMCLHAINDALKIQPNYPVGDDNKPTFTAPANVPDIECFYESFNMICEVTMLSSRDQWINEGQPVMRHLRDFEAKNNDNSFCLFIAPRIHRDTFNTFNISNKYEYEGKKQKIVPLNITQFIKLLKRVAIKKKENNPITQKEFKEVLTSLYNLIINSSNLELWITKSNELVDKYSIKGIVK